MGRALTSLLLVAAMFSLKLGAFSLRVLSSVSVRAGCGGGVRMSQRVLSATTAVRMLSSTTAASDVSNEHVPISPASQPLRRSKVHYLFANAKNVLHTQVKVQGWVRTVRHQKNFSFIELNDGSQLQGLQIIADATLASYDQVHLFTTGAAVEIVGQVVPSQGREQPLELQATTLALVGACPVDSYPLQKKRHSQEFLRSIAHLRARTNAISAVARIRSQLAAATHAHFQSQGFVYLQSPIITASDCEGAGEMFRVTTLPVESPHSIPRVNTTAEEASHASADFAQDFFGKPAFLTVSGQLSAETYACALGDVYTFGPTFRAEKSATTRHLAEFWMIEPEMAFADMHSAMDNAESFVKQVVKHVVDHCDSDLQLFVKFFDKRLLDKLNTLVTVPFVRVSYREAIALLQTEIAKNPSQWAYPDVEFGTDLQTEHERWLAETHFKSCVFVHNYPRKIKAFYMRDNDDGETVDSFDLLVPGVGELIGGSQREERLERLQHKMKEFGLNPKEYEWYLDLRRFGSVPHAGFGLGFERLVCFVTGIENIREAIAFPRYPGNAEF